MNCRVQSHVHYVAFLCGQLIKYQQSHPLPPPVSKCISLLEEACMNQRSRFVAVRRSVQSRFVSGISSLADGQMGHLSGLPYACLKDSRWFSVKGGHGIWHPPLRTSPGGNKAMHGEKMLLCQRRFLGNNSFNYFSVCNHSALLTFRTCLISSSDFCNERADICRWDRSTFGSCLTFQPQRPSLCFLSYHKIVLVSSDFAIFVFCPYWSLCLDSLFWTWQSLQGIVQVSLPLGLFSCTTIPNSSPPPFHPSDYSQTPTMS